MKFAFTKVRQLPHCVAKDFTNGHRTLRLKTTIYESDQVYHVGLEPTTLSKVETTTTSNFSQLFSVKSSSKTILYLPADLKKNIYQN